MREALGPYRAALTQGRRRSIILLVIIAIGIFGAVAWSSFRPLERQRNLLKRLEAGRVTPQNIFEFTSGYSCFGPEPVGPDVTPGGPGPVEKPLPPGVPGAEEQTCQFTDHIGEPFGPRFHGADLLARGEIPQEVIDQIKPAMIQHTRAQLVASEQGLAPRTLFLTRLRAIGTLLGVGFVVVFAATLFGAEMRWGVWRTLLTHEPRRGVLLTSKLGGLWTYVLVGIAVALAVATAVDTGMRTALDVDATGGPSIGYLAEQTGWAALSLTTYATIAAALAASIRTSIAGVAALLFLLGDHLLTRRFIWLRHYSPTQQVASLLPQPATISSGHAWPPPIVQRVVCGEPIAGSPDFCREVLLKPIPHWRASLVLGGWVLAFALAAWAVLRARDVPQ